MDDGNIEDRKDQDRKNKSVVNKSEKTRKARLRWLGHVEIKKTEECVITRRRK